MELTLFRAIELIPVTLDQTKQTIPESDQWFKILCFEFQDQGPSKG